MLWYEKFDHKFQSNVDIKKDTIQGVFFNGGE